jgi:hypothetical protein
VLGVSCQTLTCPSSHVLMIPHVAVAHSNGIGGCQSDVAEQKPGEYCIQRCSVLSAESSAVPRLGRKELKCAGCSGEVGTEVCTLFWEANTAASAVLDRYRSISSDAVSLWISLWPEYATLP